VLYLVACGAPRTRGLPDLVTAAQAAGWEVCVVATPSALRFLDNAGIAAIERATGYLIAWEYRPQSEPRRLPLPDAMIVCPATFNTINKWAAGISDTLALGLITEAIGKGLPIVAAPALNTAQAAHWAFDRSVTELRAAGVTVLYGPGIYQPAPPGTGGRPYRWETPIEALHARLAERDPPLATRLAEAPDCLSVRS